MAAISINMSGLLKSMKFSLHLIFHPFDGFWDLKHEKKGSLGAAWTFVILLILAYIFKKQSVGYFFNPTKPEDLNIITEILNVFLPLGLWCIANWCFTTLMDGEGSLKDIFIATSYALVPMILIYFPATLVSNVLSLDEKAYFDFFIGLANVWTLALIFLGTMVTHQYSGRKTIITSCAIIIGMGIIIFIGLLFYNLIQQVSGFVVNIYREITFRMY